MNRYTRYTLVEDVEFGRYYQVRIQHMCRNAKPPFVRLGDLMDAGKNVVRREPGMGDGSWTAIQHVLAKVPSDPDMAGEFKELYF